MSEGPAAKSIPPSSSSSKADRLAGVKRSGTKPGAKPVSKDPEKAPEKALSDGDGKVAPLGAVVIRNEFYRDGYRTMLKVALLQAVIIVGLIGAMLFVIHVHQPENRYFATTEDGRLVPMLALSEPNLSVPALMSWATQASTEVMTFGFNDYKRRMQEASRNFTRKGWESFTLALERSLIIEMVEKNQQVVTAAPRGAPVLQSEGLVQGRYQWVLQIPLVLSYQSGSKVRNDNLMVTLVIVRVPRLESPNGVGIEQWIAVPG